MYYGESAIINIDLNSYIDNFLNEQVLLDEISIGEIGKFIKDKLVALWNKFLEIVKIIRDKIIGFVQKIFSKKKESSDNAKQYETITKEEYEKAFNKSKEAQEKRDVKKGEPIDVGYEEVKESLLFEQPTIEHRYLKYDPYKQVPLNENLSTYNYLKLELIKSIVENFDTIIDICGGNTLKNIGDYDKCKSAVDEINKNNESINEKLEKISDFDSKSPVSYTYKNLCDFKDNFSASYLYSSSANYILEHKFNSFDFANNKIREVKVLENFVSKNMGENIKKIQENVKQMDVNTTGKIEIGSKEKTIWNDYVKSITNTMSLYNRTYTEFIKCLKTENAIDESLIRIYINSTIPYVIDDNGFVMDNDNKDAKKVINQYKKNKLKTNEIKKYNADL